MNALRRRVYLALARALLPPDATMARQVANGTLRRLLARAFREMGIAVCPTPEGIHPLRALCMPEAPARVLAVLRAEYLRLFQDPSRRLELTESVYRPWAPTTLSGTPLAARSGLLMAESAQHLVDLYRLTGHRAPAELAGRPDHLVLELEFMAFLVDNRSPMDQAQFLRDHLDWLPELQAAAATWQPGPFYAGVLALVTTWAEWDRWYMNRLPPPPAVRTPTPNR